MNADKTVLYYLSNDRKALVIVDLKSLTTRKISVGKLTKRYDDSIVQVSQYRSRLYFMTSLNFIVVFNTVTGKILARRQIPASHDVANQQLKQLLVVKDFIVVLHEDRSPPVNASKNRFVYRLLSPVSLAVIG